MHLLGLFGSFAGVGLHVGEVHHAWEGLLVNRGLVRQVRLEELEELEELEGLLVELLVLVVDHQRM